MQTQSITLDFCRNDYKTITVKQYDKDSRNLLITCTDNGVVYKLDSSTQECNVKMNTPDNRAIYNAATINEDGKVFITFDENMVYDSGTGQLEIHIIEQSTKRTLSSMILTVIIVGSVYSDDKIIASDEFNALTDALLGIDEAYQKASEAVEAAQEVTDRVEKFEEQAVRAETVREQNEQLRQENTTKAINAANAATTSATQATSSANTAASQAREATTRLEQLERQVEQTETVREQNEQQRKETAVRAENAASAATSAANATNNAVTKAQEAANRVEQLEGQIEQAESVREQNEQKRQSNTSQAVSASNDAASAANQATSNANKAAQNANTATDRANAAAEACEGVVLGAGLIPVAEKGAAGGVATLDSDGTLTDSQMPSLIYEKSGTTLTLKDSVAGGLKIDRICGGSKQETTSGKQLFDASTAIAGYINQSDGTVYANGAWMRSEFISVSPLNDYCISQNTNAYFQYNVIFYDETKTFISGNSRNIGGVTEWAFRTPENTKYMCMAYSVVVGDTTVDRGNIMLNAGTEALPWEPYTGGIPSPNPEYPQPIVSAGQMLVDGVVSDVGISKKLTGKNLLKNTAVSQTINGVTFTVNEDGSVTANGTATAAAALSINSVTLPSGDYILSGCPNGGKWDTYSLQINYGSQEVGSGLNVTLSDSEKKNVRILIYIGTTVSNLVFKPMLRLASIEDDTYEPYTEQTLTLNRVLRGIQVTDASLANYTDADGQMWCADYIDAERGVLVQRVGEFVFDGSEDEGWSLSSESRIIFATKLLKNAMSPVANKNEANMLCDSLITYPYYYYGDSGTNELYAVTDGISLASGGSLYVRMNSIIEIVDLASFKAHLAENPITVVYELATPIETPLTDEEIIALHQLKTYQGVTHIFGSNDPDAPMIFKYSSSEIGGVTLENSNLHAVNEVLRRQILNEIPEVWPLERGGTGATDAATALTNLGGAKASETIKTAFYDDAAENIGQLLDAKCAHARELNAPAVCIYGGWQNIDFGVFYAQVVNNVVQGIYVKGDTAYIVRCDNGTDTATYLEVAVQSDIDAIGAGTEITDVTQITQGGMYYSNGNVANAPTNDGVYYEYFASKNGWIVSIIARSGSDGATYVSNNGYDGTTWTNKGWHRLITDVDLPYKIVIDDTAGTIDFIDR